MCDSLEDNKHYLLDLLEQGVCQLGSKLIICANKSYIMTYGPTCEIDQIVKYFGDESIKVYTINNSSGFIKKSVLSQLQ